MPGRSSRPAGRPSCTPPSIPTPAGCSPRCRGSTSPRSSCRPWYATKPGRRSPASMPASSDTALSIEQLDVRFGKGDEAVHAVRDLSLAVRRGASFGLVGDSGSGKSTVLRDVAGLAGDWTGRYAVEGKALGQKRAADFYKTEIGRAHV